MSRGLLLFGLLAVCWLLQYALVYRQSQAFMATVADLRRLGTTAIGMAGAGWGRRRTYVALAAGRDGLVRGAAQLSGVTVWARPQALPDLEGRSLTDLAAAGAEGTDRRDEAAAMAARTLLQQETASQDARDTG